MKHGPILALVVVGLGLLAQAIDNTHAAGIAPATNVITATGGPYRVDWFVDSSGGMRSSGGTYSMTSTMGQPGVGVLSGVGYTLRGGFLPAAAHPPPDEIFKNGFE